MTQVPAGEAASFVDFQDVWLAYNEELLRANHFAVEAIDLDRQQVTVGGEALGYDRLVIALGSVTNYFGNASIERSAASLKTLGDAVAIRNRVVQAFERADVEHDVAARKALLTFVIVGGGATGVELTGSLFTLIQNGLVPVYPNVDPSDST